MVAGDTRFWWGWRVTLVRRFEADSVRPDRPEWVVLCNGHQFIVPEAELKARA